MNIYVYIYIYIYIHISLYIYTCIHTQHNSADVALFSNWFRQLHLLIGFTGWVFGVEERLEVVNRLRAQVSGCRGASKVIKV